MRDRLTIGEAARLVGVTPKAIRHYHKVGLLREPPRSESGYRLYGASELLRLAEIRRLRKLGLSLAKVHTVLGNPEQECSLREVLEALLEEVEGQMEHLEQRRYLLREMLAEDAPSKADQEPYMLKLARQYLGERWSNIDQGALEQAKTLWTTLDAFRWPEGYRELQEALVLYLADHAEEYTGLLALEGRLAALADVPEDSPEVATLARDYAAYFKKNPLPEDLLKETAWAAGPLGTALSRIVMNTMSPAQKKCTELLHERVSGGEA